MKNVSLKFTSAINKIMLSVMALLGFYSCSNNEEEIRCEYGTPYAKFETKGVVTNEAGEAIPNIQVNIDIDGESSKLIAQEKTDAQGKFTSSFTYFAQKTWKITAEDIDGAINGSYETKSDDITFTSEDLVEKGEHWYAGKFSKEINIKLESKK